MRAHQSFICAHNAHVVPHEPPEFIPIVGNDHGLIGVGDLGFIPLGYVGKALGFIQGADDFLCRALTVNQAFEQRIARQSICPM